MAGYWPSTVNVFAFLRTEVKCSSIKMYSAISRDRNWTLEYYIYSLVAELSRARAALAAELHAQENLIIYASQKFWFWQNHPYVRSLVPTSLPFHESRSEILHFKHLRVLAVNRMASWTY